jgi:hypothetical protein
MSTFVQSSRLEIHCGEDLRDLLEPMISKDDIPIPYWEKIQQVDFERDKRDGIRKKAFTQILPKINTVFT